MRREENALLPPDALTNISSSNETPVIVRDGRRIGEDDGARLEELPKRIRAKIRVDASGCWIWTARTRSGYGLVRWQGPHVSAHRLVYRLLVDDGLLLSPGRRGDALTLDHGCRNRACVNPEHLELVTNRENGLRGRNGVLGDHASPFVGVYWNHTRWSATVKVGGRQIYLGTYATEAAAARTYDAAASILFGDPTNCRLGYLPDPPSSLALDVARVRLERAGVELDRVST